MRHFAKFLPIFSFLPKPRLTLPLLCVKVIGVSFPPDAKGDRPCLSTPNIYQTPAARAPIVELRGYLAACGLRGRLYAYLNYNGPTGTARDELAEGMLALALERGALNPRPDHRGGRIRGLLPQR